MIGALAVLSAALGAVFVALGHSLPAALDPSLWAPLAALAVVGAYLERAGSSEHLRRAGAASQAIAAWWLAMLLGTIATIAATPLGGPLQDGLLSLPERLLGYTQADAHRLVSRVGVGPMGPAPRRRTADASACPARAGARRIFTRSATCSSRVGAVSRLAARATEARSTGSRRCPRTGSPPRATPPRALRLRGFGGRRNHDRHPRYHPSHCG